MVRGFVIQSWVDRSARDSEIQAKLSFAFNVPKSLRKSKIMPIGRWKEGLPDSFDEQACSRWNWKCVGRTAKQGGRCSTDENTVNALENDPTSVKEHTK